VHGAKDREYTPFFQGAAVNMIGIVMIGKGREGEGERGRGGEGEKGREGEG